MFTLNECSGPFFIIRSYCAVMFILYFAFIRIPFKLRMPGRVWYIYPDPPGRYTMYRPVGVGHYGFIHIPKYPPGIRATLSCICIGQSASNATLLVTTVISPSALPTTSRSVALIASRSPISMSFALVEAVTPSVRLLLRPGSRLLQCQPPPLIVIQLQTVM